MVYAYISFVNVLHHRVERGCGARIWNLRRKDNAAGFSERLMCVMFCCYRGTMWRRICITACYACLLCLAAICYVCYAVLLCVCYVLQRSTEMIVQTAAIRRFGPGVVLIDYSIFCQPFISTHPQRSIGTKHQNKLKRNIKKPSRETRAGGQTVMLSQSRVMASEESQLKKESNVAGFPSDIPDEASPPQVRTADNRGLCYDRAISLRGQ